MTWIRSLSRNRALALAVAWPVTLVVLAGVVLGFAKVYSLWIDWQSGGTSTFFMRLRVRDWSAAAIIFFLPPALFLLAWRLASSRGGDRAA